MQVTDRIYERLTPDERFRVATEAFARRDWAEADRLSDTSGYATVRVQSPAYFERLRGIHTMAMLHGIGMRDLAIGFLGALYRLEMAADRHVAAGMPESGEAAAADTGEAAAESLLQIISRIKAYRAAWAAFCTEVGIDPVHVEFAYHTESALFLDIFDDIEADEEAYRLQLKTLRDSWRDRLSRVAGLA